MWMNEEMKNRYHGRNYAIDAIKVVFAISVALGHFQHGTFLSSNTVVEVFFLMSGYFLAHSYLKGQYTDAYDYTKSRLKRIYPYYIAAFLFLFMYIHSDYIIRPVSLLRMLFSSLPEMLLIQNIGIFNGGVNYPLWQLCVLYVVSHLLFGLLSCNKNITINVLCPVLTILSITYLANVYETHTVDIFTVESKFFYVPLFRAAGFVSAGIFLQRPIDDMVQKIDSLRYRNHIYTVISIVALWVFYEHQWDYISHIAFVAILICCLSRYGILSFLLNRKVFAMGEKVSLSIYLNHALVIYFFQHFEKTGLFSSVSGKMIVALYIIALLAFSFAFIMLVEICVKQLKRCKKAVNDLQ